MLRTNLVRRLWIAWIENDYYMAVYDHVWANGSASMFTRTLEPATALRRGAWHATLHGYRTPGQYTFYIMDTGSVYFPCMAYNGPWNAFSVNSPTLDMWTCLRNAMLYMRLIASTQRHWAALWRNTKKHIASAHHSWSTASVQQGSNESTRNSGCCIGN